jgi:hypothetical protein
VSLPSAARAGISTVDRGPGWRASFTAALAAFAVFRIATEAVGVVAALRASRLSGTALFVDIWRQWDVNWMADIAQHGYLQLSHVVEAGGSVKDGTAFPPAMPLLLRGAAAVGVPTSLAGLLWSGLFLVLGLALLYRLSALDFDDGIARWTLVFTLAYPFSLFLATGYAEALVLFAAVGAFYAARRRWWLVAGILVGVALLAKIVFILLLLPLSMEWLGFGEPQDHPLRPRRSRLRLLALWVPPLLALGGWMFYLQRVFGEPLRFLTAQKGWGRAVGLPLEQVGQIFDGRVNSGIRFINAVDVVAVLFLIAMAVYALRRLRPSYGVLLLMFAALFTFNTSLESNGRHLSVLFPIFIGLAVWTRGRGWLRVLLVLAQLPLAALFVARFATGHWAG